jgi:hypothetical protein
LGVANVVRQFTVIPPTITNIDPPNNSIQNPGFRTVTIHFSEALDVTTVTAQSVQLLGLSGPVVPQKIQFSFQDTEVKFTYPELSGGDYQIVIHGTAVKDPAGNVFSPTNVVTFFSINALTSAEWINPSGGFWDVPANWASGVLPGPTDDVLIDVPANVTVTFRQGTSAIHSLVSSNAFTITGGILAVATTIQVDNTFTLSGGTLAGATVLPGSGGQGLTVTGGSLNGVTLNADATMAGQVTAVNGLTVNAALRLFDSSGGMSLYFKGTQTLGGTGEVVFSCCSSQSIYAQSTGSPLVAATLTIGSGITVHGSGPGGRVLNFLTDDRVINLGTISADAAGASITFAVDGLFGTAINQGTLQALNGGTLNTRNLENVGLVSIGSGSTLTLGGSWNNAGTIIATSATVTLGGSFTQADLGTFNRTGGTVNLSGTLSGGLTLDAATGSWNLSGTISGGTVTTSGGAQLVVLGGILSGVTLATDVTIGATISLTIVNGLTLSGGATIALNSAGNSYLFVNGTQTIGGTGQIVFAGISLNQNLYVGGGNSGASTLTLGTNVTVRGQGSILEVAPSTLINQGTIQADVSGQTLNVSLKSFTNAGTVQAIGGGMLAIQSAMVNSGALTPGNPPQLLNVTGTFTQQVAGALNIHIGSTTPGTGFSQVKATGGVGLDGTLNLTLINSFVPSLGATFEIMTFASRSGQFATINGLTFAVGKQFLATYTPTNLTLQVVAAAPIARASVSSPLAVDTDGDGMSDAFELVSGLNPHDSRDAQLDSDGDGLTNLEEFQLGTDPLNPDRTPPTVLAVFASAGNTNVAVNSSAAILFSEPILPGSVTQESVQVFLAGQAIEGTVVVAESRMSATFHPATKLSADAHYEVRITGVRDRAGNSLVEPVVVAFETSDQPDQTAPVLLGVTSVSAATPLDTVIVEFDEPLDPTLITERTIRLVDPATDAAVAGTIRISEDGREVSFVPSAPPPANTEYCLILDCLADLAGNCAESSPPLCLTTGN